MKVFYGLLDLFFFNDLLLFCWRKIFLMFSFLRVLVPLLRSLSVFINEGFDRLCIYIYICFCLETLWF